MLIESLHNQCNFENNRQRQGCVIGDFFLALLRLHLSWEWLSTPDDIEGHVCVNRWIGYISSDFDKGYLYPQYC